MIAGLAAEGYTMVDEIGYIQRGYECFEEKLQALGSMMMRERWAIRRARNAEISSLADVG